MRRPETVIHGSWAYSGGPDIGQVPDQPASATHREILRHHRLPQPARHTSSAPPAAASQPTPSIDVAATRQGPTRRGQAETLIAGWWSKYGDVLADWFEAYLGLEGAASVIRT